MGRRSNKHGVVTLQEEDQLVKWILKMANMGHSISLGQCRLKVVELTQEKEIPCTNGVHGDSWVKQFKKRYHDLSLRTTQGLEQAKAKGLYSECCIIVS